MDPVSVFTITYVATKCYDQFIKEEAYGRLKRFFFPEKKYKKQLIKIIDETIDEFEQKHPHDNSGGNFPFYHSHIFFEHLSLYVLFKKGTLDEIKGDFNKFPKIIQPTPKDLEDFYSLFTEKVNADKVLKELFIDENYKNQIFDISKALEEVRELVVSVKTDTTSIRTSVESLVADNESKKLTPDKISQALKAQVNRQLKKQINSGKYLQNTFIETGEQKDDLRYLCDSVFYSEKCFYESSILDFRYFNNFLAKKEHPPFNYDFEKLKPTNGEMNVNNCTSIISKWHDYLVSKRQEITDIKIGSNEKYNFESKFRDRIDDLEFLRARVALITETAGQGKTNFLCDFSENFLLKREIPTAFLTGTEVNAQDLRQSLLQRIFPDSSNLTFEEFLYNLKCICYEQGKFFVLIIDGINENYNSKLLSQNLETFVSELLEHDFVKIVLSCRTEYYEQNFSNLESSSFKKEMKKITSLFSQRPDDDLKKKLLRIYFNHFKIKHYGISNKAHEQLVENFLLLRIFCEAYQNQKLERIENIYKQELFEKYYETKSDEINKRLKTNDEFKVSGNFDIRNFIQSVVEFMIHEKTYVNVPLDQIIANPSDREMYVRFLDENILVKRDIQTDEKGIFTSSEVVNFTFDEFRDFLISQYLVEVLYKKSVEEFTSYIENQVNDKSPLLEGCSTFLFYISRKSLDKQLHEILVKQPWFEAVFSKCIFSLKDSQVTNEDKNILKGKLLGNERYSDSIIWNLIIRYDITYYQNLSIEFLFKLLRELDEKQYVECFASKFGKDSWGHSRLINQENLVNQIDDILENREADDVLYYEKLFELLVYLFTNKNSWDIETTYEKFYFRHTEKGKAHLKKALESKNKSLTTEIKQFIRSYEISL
jgi:regulator of replication initiation timing